MDANLEPKPARKRQPGARAQRRRRVLLRMREGWAYEEIARAEKVTVERLRKLVADMLKRREVDDESDHARVQLARLDCALQSAGEAVAAGDIKAIGPFLRVLDRVDHYRGVVAQRAFDGEHHRQRLMAKINRMVEAMEEEKQERAQAGLPDEPAAEAPVAPVEADSQETEVSKFFPRNFGGRR